ncbi:unnamed protein product [Urochloa decumbens]|uniref:Uncharacterized protein n=1 Tax=Urochloa decumbens TaxID=240449 RepID=A0ABC9BVX4_9POAL
MGAMNPLLGKLTVLMGDEYKKLKRLPREVSFLTSELNSMKALLEKMDYADELDPQAKNWRKDIVDMSYDMEDYIDGFIHHVDEADHKVGILQKASHRLKAIKERYRIANQIQEIKDRVFQASERRMRYKIDECISVTTMSISVDPRLSALYKESTNLVGINKQKEDLVKWVMDEGQQLKVMSIVGFGGLGKTTLVNEVYREVRGQFNCNIFVSISQKPDMTRLLNGILSQQLHLPPPSYACEVKDLIDILGGYLQDKRIFGSEVACPSQFMNVSCEILKKCGGLPLAIITVASILACQPRRIKEQWEQIKNSLSFHSSTNPTLEDMMHILDLSYKNLPRHLKACFLYLGFYPEDRLISKIELARRWVAEGFVSNSHGLDVWEVAKNYFNELVNRSMIQPVYDKHNFEVVSCRVHDMMLELIIRRGREDNFITVAHDPHALRKVQDKVRRLSVDSSGGDDDTIMQLSSTSCVSHVRSLAIHGASKYLPPLSELKFLRVLFIEFTKRVDKIDLTGIVHLRELRYLKVECNRWSPDAPDLHIVLPNQIRRLKHLETLEMPRLSICIIPSTMVELSCLSHLALPSGTRWPDGIGKMKSLRTWDCFSLHKSSPANIRALGELTNLASLTLNGQKEYWETKMRCTDDHDTPEAIWMPALSCSLEKLGNLKRLRMVSISKTCDGDALSLVSSPSHKLEFLELGLNFSRVPRWMGDLHNLRSLRLGLVLKETATCSCWEEEIGIIGRLPSLVKLWLRMPIALAKRILICRSTGFMVLEQFFLECDGISYLTFEAGAMPTLWKIRLSFDPDGWDKVIPAGLHNLSRLKEIHVSTKLIRGVFQEAADALPSSPAVIIAEFGHRKREDVKKKKKKKTNGKRL